MEETGNKIIRNVISVILLIRRYTIMSHVLSCSYAIQSMQNISYLSVIHLKSKTLQTALYEEKYFFVGYWKKQRRKITYSCLRIFLFVIMVVQLIDYIFAEKQNSAFFCTSSHLLWYFILLIKARKSCFQMWSSLCY